MTNFHKHREKEKRNRSVVCWEREKRNSRWNMNMNTEYVYGRWKRLWVVTVVTVYDVHFEINDAMFFALVLYQFLIKSSCGKRTNSFEKPMRYEVDRYRYEYREYSNVNHFTYLFIRYELRIGRWSLDYNSKWPKRHDHIFSKEKACSFFFQQQSF